jgi:hypothetical protein
MLIFIEQKQNIVMPHMVKKKMAWKLRQRKLKTCMLTPTTKMQEKITIDIQLTNSFKIWQRLNTYEQGQ